jgi:hypothetical protein
MLTGTALMGCNDTADPPTTPPTAPDPRLPDDPSEGPGGITPMPQSPRDNDPTPAPPPPGPRSDEGVDDDSGFGVLDD